MNDTMCYPWLFEHHPVITLGGWRHPDDRKCGFQASRFLVGAFANEIGLSCRPTDPCFLNF
jgi:hypothetical protein